VDDEGTGKNLAYQKSIEYNDPAFGLTTVEFVMFLLLITLLWGLAAVEEYRIIIVWWNVLVSLPTVAEKEPCLANKIADEEESSLEVRGLHRRSRWLIVACNLLPRSILQNLIFVVGIQYLLSVNNISDLILNSLALTFLVTVDEMIFGAFATQQDATIMRQTLPMRGRSIRWVDK
ncbi:unnamed protein product, partial [Symbiodinium pilosum]